jgi:hypothetical protein
MGIRFSQEKYQTEDETVKGNVFPIETPSPP